MLELRDDTLADVLGLLFVCGGVACEGGQDGDTSPFGAFVKCDEEFIEDGGCYGEEGGVGRGGCGWYGGGGNVDIGERCNGVRHDL